LPLTLPDASREVLEAALAEGRGVVFATAHLGAWEAIGPVLASHGFDVATIARRSYDPRFDRVYDRLRGAHGVRSLYRGDPGFTKALVKCLRGGVVVGFTMDLAGRGVRTVTIPWPDGERPTPIGPAEIALRTRSPVVIGTAAPGRILRIEAVSPRTDDDPRALTETIAAVLGTRLLAYPSAWPWMHRGPREEITAGSLPTLAHGR
jgi:KDO2-lipid IV(A) lauroyltransferase